MLCVRRFFCDDPGCQARMFAEQIRHKAVRQAHRARHPARLRSESAGFVRTWSSVSFSGARGANLRKRARQVKVKFGADSATVGRGRWGYEAALALAGMAGLLVKFLLDGSTRVSWFPVVMAG